MEYYRDTDNETKNKPLRYMYYTPTYIRMNIERCRYYILIARVLGGIYIRHELTIDMVW